MLYSDAEGYTMQRRTRFYIAIATMITVAALASAEGAGGLLFGVAKPGWNPNFMPEPQMPADLEYFGGYGYGISERGNIVGGFGMAIMDYAVDRMAGGAGGMIVGWRLVRDSFIHVDLVARLGLGGMAAYSGKGWKGFAIYYVEPLGEIGIGLTPWMHLSATLGYQLIGNFVPGKPSSDIFMRSPTLGFTLTWGVF